MNAAREPSRGSLAPGERPDHRRLAARLYELFNAGELDALLELAAEEIEWDWSRSIGFETGVYHGKSRVRRFIEEQLAAWETVEMIPEEIVEAEGELVALVRVRVVGRDGIEVEARGAHMQSWREGKLVRYRLYQDREEALADLAD